MNTKMILEVAGAKPLATSCNTGKAMATGKADGVKGLVAEKRPVAVRGNLGFLHPPKTCNTASGGMAVPEAGLGEGMWKGVFG